MKKLMMAVAIVCAAAATQAAMVTWKAASIKTPSGTGTYSGSGIGAAATLSIYLVTEKVFTDTAVDAIYDYVTDNKKSADFSGKSNMSTATVKSGNTYATGDKVYALELITYNDGKDDWYVANKSWVEISAIESVAQDATSDGLNTTIGGGADSKSWTGSGATITGWEKVESVPEPFSGTLALLGMGAIALRRKMKKAKKA